MNQHVGQHYEGEAGADYFAYQLTVAEDGARLNAPKFQPHIHMGDTVVDFGCGGGFVLERLTSPGPRDSARIGIRRIGIEPNEHSRAAGIARGLEIVATPAEIADATADLVISNHALEHTTNPFGELRELRRILKLRGRFVLYVPLDDWRAQKDMAAPDPNHHLYTWTPLTLRNLLSEAGFDVRDVRVVSHGWSQRIAPLSRRLPPAAFSALTRLWAVARRRRQLVAVCQVAPD